MVAVRKYSSRSRKVIIKQVLKNTSLFAVILLKSVLSIVTVKFSCPIHLGKLDLQLSRLVVCCKIYSIVLSVLNYGHANV